MNAAEAEECFRLANQHLDSSGLSYAAAMKELSKIRVGRGWIPLGYSSWRHCAMDRIHRTAGRVYQLLAAEEVMQNISTVVENPTVLPETHLREFTRLGAAQQGEAYRKMQAIPKATAHDARNVAKMILARMTNDAEVAVMDEFERSNAEEAKQNEKRLVRTWQRQRRKVEETHPKVAAHLAAAAEQMEADLKS